MQSQLEFELAANEEMQEQAEKASEEMEEQTEKLALTLKLRLLFCHKNKIK